MLITPHSGRLLVMDFCRKGMSGAQPRFAVWEGNRTRGNSGLMRTESQIGNLTSHPDARLMARAPSLLAALQRLLDVGIPCDRCYEDACDPLECSCLCHEEVQKARDSARAEIMAATGGNQGKEGG